MSESIAIEQRIMALESQVQKLTAFEEIRDLKNRYWHYLDSHLWRLLQDVFARDASIDYGFGMQLKGNKVIARGLGTLTPKQFSLTAHQGHNPELELISDTLAKGRWQLDQFCLEVGTNAVVKLGGVYEDVYTKEDGVWKIQSSIVNHIYWHVSKPDSFISPDTYRQANPVKSS